MSDKLPAGLFKHGRQYRCRVYRDGKRTWKGLGTDETEAIARFQEIHGDAQSTMAGVIERYRRDVLPAKAPSTQQQQGGQADRLKRVFGHMTPAQITPPMAIQYLDMRGKVAGNREIALLRHILTKCVHWGMLTYNPLMRLQYRVPESPRSREVEPHEIRFVMRRAKPRERYLIWLIYLTGLRREDALRLTYWHCKEDGIHTREGKTGKKLRIAWTPSLEKVTRRLRALSGNDFFPVSASGVDSEWQRLRQRLRPYDLFQLKDLRAAHAGVIEDAGGDATRQLGHSSRALTQRHYLRGGRKVTPIK